MRFINVLSSLVGGAKAPPSFLMPPGDEFQNSFDPVLQNLLDRFESDLALDEILINGTRGMVLHSRGTVEAVPSIFEDDLRMIE